MLMLVGGYKIKQVETYYIIQNQKEIIYNDSITNARITDLNRKFYKDFALVLKEDYCNTVKNHIDKTHTQNHLICKYLKE